MTDKPRDPATYVNKVRQETNEYVQGILNKNEELRSIVARLQQENQHLRSEVEQSRREHQELEERLRGFEEESRLFEEQYVTVEKRNNDLAQLFVASYRLYEKLEVRHILDAVHEIVANLIGSEEHAVFDVTADGKALARLSAVGLAPDAYLRIPLGAGPIGSVVAKGEIYVAEQSYGEPTEAMTACIPLRLDDEVVGAIVIFRLLQQKTGLEEADFELMNLLATHVATALYCARLNAKRLGTGDAG